MAEIFNFLDEKALKDLPPINDLTLLTLKGHLIIERIINGIIESHCKEPEYLSKARLSFAQKVYIAQSLALIPGKKTIWAAIHNLNKLRNHLSHNIDASKAEELAVKFVMSSEIEITTELDIDISSTAMKVRGCIAQIVGFLQAYGHLNHGLYTSKMNGRGETDA
jgi:hypothetical protein